MNREEFGMLAVGFAFGSVLGVIAGVHTGTDHGWNEATVKHCQHIESRTEFEECKQDFLGDEK